MNKKQTLINLIIALLSTGLFLGLAELYFRHTGKYATYNEKLGQPYFYAFKPQESNWYHVHGANQQMTDQDPEFSYPVQTNNEGLVDKKFDTAKTAGSIRIMVIGDSFIQGIGAPHDSSCPKQLEALLNKKFAGKTNIEVWNCGVAGSDPFFEYTLFANRLLKYKPDFVVVAVNGSDINDVMIRGGSERFHSDSTVAFRKSPWFEPLYAKSFIVRRVVHDVMHYNWEFLSKKDQVEVKANSIACLKSSLQRFKELCNAKNIPLLIAFQPMREEMDGSYPYEIQPLVSFCDSANIPFVDLKIFLEKEGYAKKAESLYWPVNGHFNSEGYKYYAQCLAFPLVRYMDSVLISGQIKL